MSNFQLRLLNFPAERLINPRPRLPGRPIPKDVIKLLPLKESPFKKISIRTDCIQLLEFFNDFYFDNVADLKEYILEDETATLFKESSDDKTGIMLLTVEKYLFLSKRLLQILAADDTIFSFTLPFLAEAIADLECSYYLMKGQYFKQSLQTLRNVLELTLLHAYFSLKYLDDDELNNAIQQRYPSLKEIIVFLRTGSLLTGHLEQKYFELYRALSQAVHSQIAKLTISTNFTYKSAFSEWYSSFTAVAVLNIQTLLRMVEAGI